MKKYFLAKGTEKLGPFGIEDLKTRKDLTGKSLIWTEGMNDWKTLEEIDELKGIFAFRSPPPLPQNSPEKSKKRTLVPTIIIFLIFVGGVFFLLQGYSNSGGQGTRNSTAQSTYKEKILSVGEVERANPLNFLDASGQYRPNLLGDKIKVEGTITNSATVTSFKDATVRVTYYSKSETRLGSEDYVIYDIFPPRKTIKFKLKIRNYKNVDAIGWDVIQAKPYGN